MGFWTLIFWKEVDILVVKKRNAGQGRKQKEGGVKKKKKRKRKKRERRKKKTGKYQVNIYKNLKAIEL